MLYKSKDPHFDNEVNDQREAKRNNKQTALKT